MISEPASSLRKREVQDRRLSIIDVSSADDSLLDGNPLSHQHSENQEHSDILCTPNSKKFEDAATKLQQWEHDPHSNDSSGNGKPKKNSKCNLRKSLAWDSAFFTSAGVLDPEELTCIIEGVEKDEKHELPAIQEDVYKSCESISTLASDSLTFESVDMEGDLFEDVRASIQKSSKKSCPAASNTKVPSSPAVPLFQTHDSSKKVGMVSRKKMKVPPASKNPIAGMQGFGKMTKKNNPIFPQIPQPVATRRESSILKQSKVPVRSSLSSTLPSKRDSLGNLHVKSERDKAKQTVGDRVSSVAKASVLGGSRGSVPKPTLPSKSPVGPTVSTRTRSVTSTSSGNNLSDNIGKSSFSYLKRSYKPTSCCSVVKTPSRIASRNKAEPEISSLSSLMSATKLSSSISPASSISDWSSSESSSTTSMAKRVCNSSRSSIDSGSSRKVLLNTDTDQGTHPQTPLSDSSLLERQEAWHSGIISQKERTAPGAAVLPPASKKASGLRLPSPKIGFFDGVKPLVRTPRGSIVPGGLPKHGAESPREGQDKAELGKLQPSRSIVSIDNTNPNNQEAPHPNPFHGSLDVAIKTSNSVQNVKSSSDVSMGAVENTSHFHVVEEAHHDLPPLNGINNQENAHHDDQIDHLSKQVGHMDINFETGEKFNGDSLYLLHNDISSQDKSNGLELSSNKELIDCPKKDELFNGLSTTYLSVSPTSFDVAASTRTPFAVKDSFCNMDGVVFTESTVSEAKLTHLPVPESIIMKENE
ncbi:hypothetical protein JHK87_007649 [Glycine soja]|nr:hypothetical protein JHK87_007649 [Glycine soja]